MLWLDRYRRTVHTPAPLARLSGMLTGAGIPDGAVLDQDRRWATLVRLTSFAFGDATAMLQAELARDGSETGARERMRADAARPETGIKHEWLDRIRDPDSDMSLARRRAVIAGLFPPQQQSLHAALADDILGSLQEVGDRHQDAFIASFGELIPRLCRPQSVARLAAAIDAYPDLNPILRKKLRVAHQEDARCLAISRALQDADGASS
jgi:aminopeptidase N